MHNQLLYDSDGSTSSRLKRWWTNENNKTIIPTPESCAINASILSTRKHTYFDRIKNLRVVKICCVMSFWKSCDDLYLVVDHYCQVRLIQVI
jgi:hypothetical protein